MEIFDENPQYLKSLRGNINWPVLSELRKKRFVEKVSEQSEMRELAQTISEFKNPIPSCFDWKSDQVVIGSKSDVHSEEWVELKSLLDKFRPWKKGPFSIFGQEIDSEWRSDLKWSRIQKVIPSLQGKDLADIGCSNGYFMFRMLAENPNCVVGMDPFAKAFLNFHFLKKLSTVRNIDFDLIGAEHAELFAECFDVVFCLGVVYHHTDPMALLKSIYKSMKKGAILILESQGIPGELPVALCPRQRYARARGIWFLPTESCLENWLSRAQFRDVECFYNEQLSIEEQRRTEWADVESLADFLDPNDMQKTVEGYPAPRRIYFKATK